MSRRSIILAIACAALFLVAVLWLAHDGQPSTSQSHAATRADSPGLRPTALESETTNDHASRQSVVASANGAPRLTDPASADTTATLIVRVTASETGKPLRTAHVLLWPARWNELGEGYTVPHLEKATGTMREGLRPGDDGSVEFTSVPSDMELRLYVDGDVNLAGNAELRLGSLAPGERREVRVALATETDLTMFGRVVASVDHTPVVHARVLTGRDENGSMITDEESDDETAGSSGEDDEAAPVQPTRTGYAESFSDDDGYFEISVAHWNEPVVRIEAEDYGLVIIVPNHGHETRETARVVELTKSATLRAHIVDARGNSLNAHQVRLSTSGIFLEQADQGDGIGSPYASTYDEQWLAVSNSAGACTLENVPPGVDLSLVIKRGHKIVYRAPEPVRLESGETRDLELRIGGGCTLRGTAIDQDGKPVVAKEILLAKDPVYGSYFDTYVHDINVSHSTTDDEGRFEFKDVTPGMWSIGPAALDGFDKQHADKPLAPLVERIEVGSSPSQEFVLHVYSGLYIRGSVVDPNGARVAGAGVNGGPESQPYGVGAQATKDGSFELGPIGPGTITLIASAAPFAPSEKLKVAAGARDVVLRLRPGTSLRGRCIDAQTGAATRSDIMLTPEMITSSPSGSGLWTSTREDGSFELNELEPGRYGIVASASGGRFGVLTWFDAPAGQGVRDLVVPVSPGGTLRLKYEGASRSTLVKIVTRGLHVTWTEEVLAGKAWERRMPAGPMVIQELGADDEVQRSIAVEVAAGEVTEVVVQDDK